MLVKVGIRVWFILEDAKFGAGCLSADVRIVHSIYRLGLYRYMKKISKQYNNPVKHSPGKSFSHYATFGDTLQDENLYVI